MGVGKDRELRITIFGGLLGACVHVCVGVFVYIYMRVCVRAPCTRARERALNTDVYKPGLY